MIETDPLRYNHKPGCKVAAAVISKCAEPAEIISPQLLEQGRVPIHRSIVIPAKGSSYIHQEAAVPLEEPVPRIFPAGARRIGKNAAQTRG
jgi:hypothetical protein